MPTLTITYHTPEERRNIEQAIAFVREMQELGLQAPHGGVIDACEAVCLDKGRDLLREVLAGAVAARVGAVEKKWSPRAGIKPATKGSGHGRL